MRYTYKWLTYRVYLYNCETDLNDMFDIDTRHYLSTSELSKKLGNAEFINTIYDKNIKKYVRRFIKFGTQIDVILYRKGSINYVY